MPIKFYRGPAVRADAEVPASEASVLRTFTKGWFDAAGTLTKAEVYDGGALAGVSYHVADDASIAASHLRDHPGVRFSVWSHLVRDDGYAWEYVRSYGPAGTLEGSSRILLDADGFELMQIDADAARRVTRTTKYSWDHDGELRYVFEYGETGDLLAVTDVDDGDHASWRDIKDDLEDVAFFEKAGSLPRALAGHAIPAAPPQEEPRR